MNTRNFTRPLSAVLLLGSLAAATMPGIATARQTNTQTSASAPFDRQFIDMMVPHHEGAVAMAKIALKRAQHQQVHTLALAIIGSQDREIGEMKSWRRLWFGSARTPAMANMHMLPGMKTNMAMTNMTMMNMSSAIRHLRGAKPFDKAFIDAMIPHHLSAVGAAQLELQRGTHAQLKALARNIIAAQQREIRAMKSWRAAWYGAAGMGHMGY